MSMPPLLPHLHTKIVTFVIFPATPRPVPSKKRQRFILCNSYRGGFAPLDLAAQGSSRCSSGNLIAAHQRNRAVLLLVVEEERTVRKPADKVIAPVLLDNPVLSHVGSYQKLGYCISFTISVSSDPCPLQPQPNQPQPLLNHPSCRIQERFRLNHPTSDILQPQLNHSQKDS